MKSVGKSNLDGLSRGYLSCNWSGYQVRHGQLATEQVINKVKSPGVRWATGAGWISGPEAFELGSIRTVLMRPRLS